MFSETKTACAIPAGTKVLVTGATGFTGAVLVKKLADAGLSVNAIARKSSNIEQFSNLPITWFRGDVFDPKVVKDACAGVSYIFHVAAAYREAKITDETYYNVHVQSTKLLAEEALKQPQFKRFIHVSTIGVHGHIDHPPADESYRFSPGDQYQITKAEAEVWFKDFATKNNLPFVVVRPAGIYGPGDKRLLKVFKMVKLPLFPILGQGKCLYHLIHVEDLCDAMIFAATSEKALGETFIVGAKESIRLEDMAGIIGKTISKHVHIIRIPVTPFFILGDICELLCKPFGIEPPIYRRRVAFYTKDRSFNTKKLHDVLGFKPKYSNEDGIIETAKWYQNKGWL